jgi:hypothetical protein
MDEIKKKDVSELEGHDFAGQAEVVVEKKEGKPLFPLSVVFGAGIASLLVMLVVFVGQTDFESQLRAKVVVVSDGSIPPAVPSDFPPCPGVDPNNPPLVPIDETDLPRPELLPPSRSSSSKPPVTKEPEPIEAYDPSASTPPECMEANCWTNFEGTVKSFERKKECIPSKPEHCKGKEGESPVEVKVCDWDFERDADRTPSEASKDSCSLKTRQFNLENSFCERSSPAENCPDINWVTAVASSTKCLACWDWVDLPETEGEKITECLSVGREEDVVATSKCEKVPQVTGQEGWWIDRSTCGYDSDRVFPASACYQSCQVHYLDPDDNCRDQPLVPGECRLKKDGPPPGIIPAPSDTPLI